MVQEVALSAMGAPAYSIVDTDDDENEVQGRILSNEELVAKLRNRADIFSVDEERRLMTTEAVSVVLAIMIGLWISRMDPALFTAISEGVVENFKNQIEGRILTTPVISPNTIQKPVPPKQVSVDRKVLHPSKVKNAVQSSSTAGGGGDIHSRVAKAGILGMLADKVTGKTVDGDITGHGGFADGIDAIISGVNGLKQSSGSGIARRAGSGIGFGPGYNSGFNGGTAGGGIDNLIGSIQNTPVELTHRVHSIAFKTNNVDGGALIGGGRNKAEILRVVMQNIQSLRYAYNKRLKDKPGLKGKITCKFAIDEFGNVLTCIKMESTLNDEELESTVNTLISRWKFEKIDKPGDVTEIIYPFVFSS